MITGRCARIGMFNVADTSSGVRKGDIELCAPFGFATYRSVGEVRELAVSKVKRGAE